MGGVDEVGGGWESGWERFEERGEGGRGEGEWLELGEGKTGKVWKGEVHLGWKGKNTIMVV